MRTLSTNTPSSNNRVSVYEWMRIIGTIFVVIGHSGYLYISTKFGGINYALPAQLSQQPFYRIIENLVVYVYGFHMPLFFFLSGAVLHLKPLKSFKKFVSGKAKRLLIPYVLVGLLFMFPIKYLTGFYKGKEIINAISYFFVSTYESGHLWFLPALFICMTVFAVMIKILQRFKWYNEYVLLFISFVLQYGNELIISTEFLGINKVFSYIFWFALGYYFETIRKKPSFIQALFLSISYIILTYMDQKCLILPIQIRIVFNCVGIYFVSELLSMIFYKLEETKGYKVFVRNLFNIYLFHDPLEYIILKMFMEHNWLNNTLGCYIYHFCRIVVVIIVSILLGEIISAISAKLKN